nr:probable serine/threonine-protein kinase PBL21 [Tanacetum cinerariifolium]
FLDHFVNALSKKISIKDLGILHHFLGVEVIPTPTGLFLSQHHRYIQDNLHQFKKDKARKMSLYLLAPNPCLPSTHLLQLMPLLIGDLLDLSNTLPLLALFSINKLSRFTYSPRQTHWQALKRVLRYLKGTIHHSWSLSKSKFLSRPFQILIEEV